MPTERMLQFPVLLLMAAVSGPAQTSSSFTIDDFFDASQLQEIHITMDPADWAQLKGQYWLDTNYRCDMEWRGLVVKGAALHSRGAGSRNAIKPGLGIDFDEFVDSQKFLTMKSLVFRNSVQDPSTIHERVSMEMFARMGLPSLREAHAKVYVNGDYAGLYLLVEQVDSRFLTSRFGESSGDLFKFNGLGDGYHWGYLGDDPTLYVPSRFEPKNHEAAPVAQWIADMIKTVNLSSSADFVTQVGKYIDMDTFLAQSAVEQFMADWDGVLGELGSTNFYLYRRKADGRGVFVVWDKEATFTSWEYSIWKNTERNALMQRALSVPEFRTHYLETLAEAAHIAGGKGGWLDRETTRITEQVRPAVLDDPVRVCWVEENIDFCPLASVEASFDWVKFFAQERGPWVESELRTAGFQLPLSLLEPGAASMLGAVTTELAPAKLAPAKLAPGGLARLELPPSSRLGIEANGFPLPRELSGVTIRLGGSAVPLVAVQSSNAIWQVPLGLPPGPYRLEVSEHGVASNAITVEVRPSIPVVFAVTHADGALVDIERPAAPGETIVLYGTGLGDAGPDFPSGEPAPRDPLLKIQGTVKAKMGGQTAKVLWAGFTPGFAGLQQLVLEVPAGIRGSVSVELKMFEEVGQPFQVLVQ